MGQLVTNPLSMLGARPLEADVPDFADALSEPDSLLALLNRMSDGVYLVDRRRTIRFWNRACEQLTGYRADEVVGHRCFEDILRHVDDEGRRLCSWALPARSHHA